jgi:phosphate transport system substrate-binding protein
MVQRQRFGIIGLIAAAILALAPVATAQNTQLTGAGSTFVYPIMTHWISDYQQQHSGLQINYQSIGSGGGIQQLKNGLVDFGASDVALTDEQLKEMPGAVIQIPESAGPVCITYNLPGLTKPLRLSADTLAGIFLGNIKNWNDASIVKLNPGVNLPSTAIMVVHRSEGSGTTGIFTTYLSAVSTDWKGRVGQGISVKWPTGLGGKGSEGVTGVIKQTPGAIGYVELSYANENHLPVVEMQNQAGEFVAPSADSASAAIDAFRAQLAKDVRLPIVNAPKTAAKAYPITGLTFLLVPKDGSDVTKRQATKGFITYIITTGQKISSGLHYAPLPESITKIDMKLLGEMQANGKPIK